MRAEIVSVATELFARNGFEETTVDDIASAASISRSSFFRYFATKEDVVLQAMVDAGEQVATALGERPVDEPVWVSLRRGFDTVIGEMTAHPDRARAMTRLIRRSPALHAAHLQRCSEWATLMAGRLAPRLADDDAAATDLRAAALAGAALACLEVANEAWIAEGCTRTFGDLLDEAMSAVGPEHGELLRAAPAGP